MVTVKGIGGRTTSVSGQTRRVSSVQTCSKTKRRVLPVKQVKQVKLEETCATKRHVGVRSAAAGATAVGMSACVCPSVAVTAVSPLVNMNASVRVNAATRVAWSPAASRAVSFKQRRSSSVVVVPRSSSSAAAGTAEEDSGASKTILLGVLFSLWYAANIVFNIYNKQVLKIFTYPINCTELQFGVGSLIAISMWTLGLHKRPKVDKALLTSIAPLALVHMLGNLLTNVSLGKVAVSFTHTIKSLEPFFSVLLSAVFLGTKPELKVVLSLLPIVAGVSLASFTEASFNWAGFGAAMGSNVTFQSRNVLSKKLMGNQKEKLDNINLFSVITIMSFVFLMPVMLVTEGFKLTPSYIASTGLDPSVILKKACIAGLMFHSYQQVSYMILQRVSPVTHSVGNCVKRVVVIIASVIAFRNPVSAVNGIGTAIALAGVFIYSQVKRLSGKK